MKTVKTFLSFVEIRTKLASVIPFALGLAYAYYVTGRIDPYITALFFAADILFDMTVTAINMYIDKRLSNERPHFSDTVSLLLIFGMMIPALAIGLYLAYLFGWHVFVAGAVCVVTGVFYTFGPAPISRSPYGEIVSGIAEGGFLPFIVYSINAPENPLFTVALDDSLNALISVDTSAAISAALVFLPAMALIAGIMLANNICDIEEDRGRRYTLPMHIGVKRGVILFEGLTALAYAGIIAASAAGAAPVLCLCAVPSAIFVVPNLIKFHRKQVKPDTFKLSVTNFAIVNALFAAFMFIGAAAL